MASIDDSMSGKSLLLIHTGWVETDIGWPNAPVGVQDGVADLLEQIKNIALEDLGRLVEYTGQILPW